MPFRTKLKRVLGGGHNNSSNGGSSDSSSLTKADSKSSSHKKDQQANGSNLPDNVYKPGEPMPRPKYRGPWNQAHQDKLSAFRFGSISSSMTSMTRRRSSANGSQYSPMGSKLPSRGPSQGPPSRRGSAWSAFSGGSGKRAGMGSRRVTADEGGVEEAEGEEGGVANVGLSRQHTAEERYPHSHPPTTAAAPTTQHTQNKDIPNEMAGLQTSRTITQTNGYLNGDGAGAGAAGGGGADLTTQQTITNGNGGRSGRAPFTADELALAMSRSGVGEAGRGEGKSDGG